MRGVRGLGGAATGLPLALRLLALQGGVQGLKLIQALGLQRLHSSPRSANDTTAPRPTTR